MQDILSETKKLMEKAIEHLKVEFSRLRVGRANPSVLEGVKVTAYGSEVSLKEVAAVGTPDARTITLQPWDKSVIADIEKAILAANLGLTPINDGKLIRITIPALTEERRKEVVKQIKKLAEDSKVSIRNTRRDANEHLKKKKDKSEISEDDLRKQQDSIQKLTDSFIVEIDKTSDTKSKEVMTL